MSDSMSVDPAPDNAGWCSIKVTQVIDPMNFYAMIGTVDTLEKFTEYEDALNRSVENVEPVTDITELARGQLILAKSQESEHWQRAQVSTVYRDEVDVFFIDYGTTELLELENIISNIPEYLIELEPQAHRCYLAGVKPIANRWIGRAVTRFCCLVEDKRLDAKAFWADSGGFLVYIFINFDGDLKSVSDILIEDDLAMADDLSPSIGPFGDYNEDSFTEMTDDQDTVKSKVPEFNPEILTEKAVTTLNKTTEEPTYHKMIVPLFRQESHSSTYGRSDANIGSLSRPHTGVEAVESIQEQVRKLYSNAPNSAYTNNPVTSAAPNPAYTNKPVTSAAHAAKREDKTNNRKSPYQEYDLKSDSSDMTNNNNKDGRKSRHKEPESCETQNSDAKKSASKDRLTEKRQTENETHKVTGSQGSREASPMENSPRTGRRMGRGRGHRSNNAETQPARKAKGGDLRRPSRSRAGQLTSKEEIQNEYEWQSNQFILKVTKVLKRLSANNIEDLLPEMTALVYPEKSLLEDLPGPKELNLLLYYTLEKVIESNDPEYAKLAVRVVSSMREHPEFANEISTVLWALQHEYVKVATGSHIRRNCDSYCTLLANLYISSLEWEESGSLNICFINMLEKWAVFNKKSQHPHPLELQLLFSRCLLTTLRLAGSAMQAFLPTEMTNIITEVRDRLLAQQAARDTREVLLEILILHAQGWRDSPHVQLCHTLPEAKEPKVKVQTQDAHTNTGNVIQYSTPTQTDPRLFRSVSYDVDCQTDALLVDDDLEEDDSDLDSEEYEDSFCAVQEMLRSLRLLNLEPMFIENGIRDSVLEAEPEELKELLKECGFKAGHILEIKKYLANPKNKEKKIIKKRKHGREKAERLTHNFSTDDQSSVKCSVSRESSMDSILCPDRQSDSILVTPAAFLTSAKAKDTAKTLDASFSSSSSSLPLSSSISSLKNVADISTSPTSFMMQSSVAANVVKDDQENSNIVEKMIIGDDNRDKGRDEIISKNMNHSGTNLSVNSVDPNVEKQHPSKRYSAKGMKSTVEQWLKQEPTMPTKRQEATTSPTSVQQSQSAKQEATLPTKRHESSKSSTSVQRSQPAKLESTLPTIDQELSRQPSQSIKQQKNEVPDMQRPLFSPTIVQATNSPSAHHKASQRLQTENNKRDERHPQKQPPTQKIYLPPPEPPSGGQEEEMYDFTSDDSDNSDSDEFPSLAQARNIKTINSAKKRTPVVVKERVEEVPAKPLSSFGQIQRCIICRASDHLTFDCPDKASKFLFH